MPNVNVKFLFSFQIEWWPGGLRSSTTQMICQKLPLAPAFRRQPSWTPPSEFRSKTGRVRRPVCILVACRSLDASCSQISIESGIAL